MLSEPILYVFNAILSSGQHSCEAVVNACSAPCRPVNIRFYIVSFYVVNLNEINKDGERKRCLYLYLYLYLPNVMR